VQTIAKTFHLPKHGSSDAEYEDACNIDTNRKRFAIADGATEASYSGAWAKQLVRAFTKGQLSIPITLEELVPLQTRWQKNIAHRHPLPWYAEEKINNGAFAAFVGIEFSHQNLDTGAQNIWRATAAGDSCLVQMRGEEMIRAFPLDCSASFNNRPNLISSSPASNATIPDLMIHCTGSWGCKDTFFLMTDALACWFLREQEFRNKPWIPLKVLETRDGVAFKTFVTDLRAREQMKNDDVTLIRIDINP